MLSLIQMPWRTLLSPTASAAFSIIPGDAVSIKACWFLVLGQLGIQLSAWKWPPVFSVSGLFMSTARYLKVIWEQTAPLVRSVKSS